MSKQIKQLESIFIIIMALCALFTVVTMNELFFGPQMLFLASLGPFISGWFIYFSLKKKLEALKEADAP